MEHGVGAGRSALDRERARARRLHDGERLRIGRDLHRDDAILVVGMANGDGVIAERKVQECGSHLRGVAAVDENGGAARGRIDEERAGRRAHERRSRMREAVRERKRDAGAEQHADDPEGNGAALLRRGRDRGDRAAEEERGPGADLGRAATVGCGVGAGFVIGTGRIFGEEIAQERRDRLRVSDERAAVENARERRVEFRGGRKTLRGIAIERGRDRGDEIPHPPDRLALHALEDRGLALAVEELLGGKQLPEHDARREQIAARSDRLSPRLLRAHVADLAAQHAGARRLAPDRFRDAEVEQLHGALGGDDDVGRRDVPMHEADRATARVGLAMRVVETAQHLRDDEGGDAGRRTNRPLPRAAKNGAQVVTRQVLHRDVGVLADGADLEDGDDVPVHERERERGFFAETRDEFRIGAG